MSDPAHRCLPEPRSRWTWPPRKGCGVEARQCGGCLARCCAHASQRPDRAPGARGRRQGPPEALPWRPCSTAPTALRVAPMAASMGPPHAVAQLAGHGVILARDRGVDLVQQFRRPVQPTAVIGRHVDARVRLEVLAVIDRGVLERTDGLIDFADRDVFANRSRRHPAGDAAASSGPRADPRVRAGARLIRQIRAHALKVMAAAMSRPQ